MILPIARMLLGKILSSQDVKAQVIGSLRASAKSSETKIDDEAVDIIEEAWNIIVPILIGKM